MNTCGMRHVYDLCINPNGIVYFAFCHAEWGGIIWLQVYSSMPHVFPLFEDHVCAKTCLKELGTFIKAVTGNENVKTSFEVIDDNGDIELEELHNLEDYSHLHFAKEEVFPVSAISSDS